MGKATSKTVGVLVSVASRASMEASPTARAGGRLDPHPHAAVRHLGPDRQGAACRRWHIGEIPQLADGDRVAEIRLGADRIVLAQRNEVAGAAVVGFEVLVGCPGRQGMRGPEVDPGLQRDRSPARPDR
ncbi:hypothetical protein ACWCXX_36780 [Streptomyces sp. NPDC001732]